MKKTLAIISIILFCLSIPTFFITFLLMEYIGDMSIFGAGIFIYGWIAFLFALIPLSSLIYGIIVTKHGVSCKKNIIAGVISLGLLVTFGCCSLSAIKDYDTSGSFLKDTEIETGLVLPKNVRAMSSSEYGGRLGNAKILDDFEREWFLEETKKENWTTLIPLRLELLLPESVKDGYSSFEYFSIYVKETRSFNPTFLENGEYNLICIAYDKDKFHLQILDSYKARLQIITE